MAAIPWQLNRLNSMTSHLTHQNPQDNQYSLFTDFSELKDKYYLFPYKEATTTETAILKRDPFLILTLAQKHQFN